MRPGPILLVLSAVGVLVALWFVAGGQRNGPRATEASAMNEAPVAMAAPASDSTHPETPQRVALADEPGAARSLGLVLVRFPDEVPLTQVPVEVQPGPTAPAGRWLGTGDDGRIVLELPPRTARLEVRVPGFEPANATLEPGARELRIALLPSSGLFGRALLPDGAPAAGAALSLLLDERMLFYPRNATQSRPHASVSNRQRVAAAAVANEHGFYYLSFPTRTSRTSVDLRATTIDGLAEVRRVELPREPVALEDILFGEPERLHVRVVDVDGRPVLGAEVWSLDGPYPGTTGAEGELSIVAPHLPALISAHALGFWLKERRHDGVAVKGAAKVESCRTRVELVLAPAPEAELRIVDEETGLPIFLGHGQTELLRAGGIVGSTSLPPGHCAPALQQ